MTQIRNDSLGAESGFTLVELLVTVAVLMILGGLSLCSYILYKENAEYAKGTATLRNARTALGVGELELPDGYALAFTQTGTSGGMLAGEMARVMPGANTPGGVRLGVEVNDCSETSGPMDRALYVVSEPCLSKESARWQKFCGGMEILLEHVSNPTPCT